MHSDSPVNFKVNGIGQEIRPHAAEISMRLMLSTYRACQYIVQMRRICPAGRRNGH